MNEATLSNEQWEVIKPLLPPQPRTGRRRQHDREVLNSMVYRKVRHLVPAPSGANLR